MSIDVDDEIIVLPRLFGSMGENLAGVGRGGDLGQFDDARGALCVLPIGSAWISSTGRARGHLPTAICSLGMFRKG
jgi:hypothetical protein